MGIFVQLWNLTMWSAFMLMLIGFAWPKQALFWFDGERNRLNSFLVYGAMVLVSKLVVSTLE